MMSRYISQSKKDPKIFRITYTFALFERDFVIENTIRQIVVLLSMTEVGRP